jgi:hypothetical protein
MRSLALYRRLLIVMALLPFAAAAEQDLEDPFLGEALYHAYQGEYFEALERLDSELAQHYQVDERNLDSLYSHIDLAEFSVGDFELHYRMHHRAGRAIKAVIEGDVDEAVRAEAAFRLARLHFQKDQPSQALAVLDSIKEPIPEAIHDDVEFLRANILLAQARPAEAVEILRSIQNADSLAGFSAYNLGIALLENGLPEAAVLQLDRAGRTNASDRAARAIRDKSNLVLGTLLFEAGQFKHAQRTLDRVRLEGPFSNQALLRAGWSDVSSEKFDRAVVPWSILAKRDATDAAVQEAQLALPFAYSKLNVHSRAAVLYENAANSYGNELLKLNSSIESVEGGEFLRALAREEIRKDKDWVVRLRSLPDAPETFYLISLMASHDFQTALQNYLDLTDMRRKLVEWQRSLDAFEDMIEIRRKYYEPHMPEIDQQFRKLDAQMRVRLEQRDHLEQRLAKMLTESAPELLVTSHEYQTLARIEKLKSTLESATATPSVVAARDRLARLEGVLTWTRETEYHDRLTEAHAHLRELNEHVDALTAQYEAFVRTRQAATHSYLGYTSQIKQLRKDAKISLTRLDALQLRQGKMLETVASRELNLRRERLEVYQNKARFAFADSYDRAVKNRAR